MNFNISILFPSAISTRHCTPPPHPRKLYGSRVSNQLLKPKWPIISHFIFLVDPFIPRTLSPFLILLLLVLFFFIIAGLNVPICYVIPTSRHTQATVCVSDDRTNGGVRFRPRDVVFCGVRLLNFSFLLSCVFMDMNFGSLSSGFFLCLDQTWKKGSYFFLSFVKKIHI